MKYIRKIVAFLIGIVFLAAVIISLGLIFAIKNINVEMITYADDCTESYNEIKETLNVFKGDSLVFLNENSVIEAVSGSNYAVVSCEKKFPCTVNVTVKERLETFAIQVGGKYSMYDSDGKFLRSSIENFNVNDGSPNVELTGVIEQDVGRIAKIAAIFKDNFKALRSLVTSINLDVNPDIEFYNEVLSFNLRSGLRIQLNDYSNHTEEKITEAYKVFSGLSDRQKLSGVVRVTYNNDIPFAEHD